jgi:hypothetical protein
MESSDAVPLPGLGGDRAVAGLGLGSNVPCSGWAWAAAEQCHHEGPARGLSCPGMELGSSSGAGAGIGARAGKRRAAACSCRSAGTARGISGQNYQSARMVGVGGSGSAATGPGRPRRRRWPACAIVAGSRAWRRPGRRGSGWRRGWRVGRGCARRARRGYQQHLDRYLLPALITLPPKSVASNRVLALDPWTVSVLARHRRRRPPRGADGYVFAGPDGRPATPEQITRRVIRLVRSAGAPPIRLHDLRHGAATLALAAGADLKVIQAMLGHASIVLTADTYTSVLPGIARHSAEAIAAEIMRAARTPPGRDDLPGLTLASPRPHDPGSEPTEGGISAAQTGWGLRGSNPEPTD